MNDTANTETANPPTDARMPRWVKGFIIAALVVIIAAVIVQTQGGASHGPGRHQPDTVTTNVPGTVPVSRGDHG